MTDETASVQGEGLYPCNYNNALYAEPCDGCSCSPIAKPTVPAPHSCDRELRESPAYQSNRCSDGARWTCSCGLSYEHVCDEAEGCFWALQDEGIAPEAMPLADHLDHRQPTVPALSDEALRDLRYAKARLENDWSCAGGYHEDDCPRCEAHRRVCKAERAIPRLLAEARAEERAKLENELRIARFDASTARGECDMQVAAARAEAQTARTAEIVAELRTQLAWMKLQDNTGDPHDDGYMAAWRDLNDWLAAHFNPEAE